MVINPSIVRNPMVTRFAEADIPWQAGRGLYRLWNERRGERQFPSRSDITPRDMKDWLPGVALIDVVRNPLRFKGRLAGTDFRRAMGYDPTGFYQHDLPDAEARIERYTWLTESGKPYFCADIPLLFADKDFQSYSVIAFPLGETDEQVDMLICHLEFDTD